MLSEYTMTIKVRGYELSADGRAGHGAFLHWFQEAAIEASTAAGYGLEEYDALGAAWVMRDVDIEFLEAPAYGQAVEVKTWVSDFHRIRSHREYEACRADNGRPLARARAEWIFLDTRTLMPRRLPAALVANFPIDPVPAIGVDGWPAEGQGESLGRYESLRRVQHYEIDQMRHVNNAVYLNWIEQQARDAWLSWGHDPAALNFKRQYIQYRQAAQDGDRLQLTSEADSLGDAIIWKHQVLRDNIVLVQARSLGARVAG